MAPLHKTASKLDWLKERKDFNSNPSARAATRLLEHLYAPHGDALYPWLLRELKRGNIKLPRPYENGWLELVKNEMAVEQELARREALIDSPEWEKQPYPKSWGEDKIDFNDIENAGWNKLTDFNDWFKRPEPEGWAGLNQMAPDNHFQIVHPPVFPEHGQQPLGSNLAPEDVKRWEKVLADRAKRRKGVDPMQYSAPDFHGMMEQEWEPEYEQQVTAHDGEVVHRYPDNWTVRRLQDPEECEREGERMGHCAGNYGDAVERGSTHLFSLRDPKNRPHTTVEIKPDQWKDKGVPVALFEKYHIPKPPAGYGSYVDSIDHMIETADHLADPYWEPMQVKQDPHSTGAMLWEIAKELRASRADSAPWHQGTLTQVYGKEDSPPIPAYKQRVRDWFGALGENMPKMERWHAGQYDPRLQDDTQGDPTADDLPEPPPQGAPLQGAIGEGQPAGGLHPLGRTHHGITHTNRVHGRICHCPWGGEGTWSWNEPEGSLYLKDDLDAGPVRERSGRAGLSALSRRGVVGTWDLSPADGWARDSGERPADTGLPSPVGGDERVGAGPLLRAGRADGRRDRSPDGHRHAAFPDSFEDLVDAWSPFLTVGFIEEPDHVNIYEIQTNEGVEKGGGVGTRFMRQAKAYCDQHGKQLRATRVTNPGFFGQLGFMDQQPRSGDDPWFVYDPLVPDEPDGTVSKVNPGFASPRMGALTRTQLLRMAQGLPEDQSEVVHDWPDGWTVRQLQTYGDMHREGQLMGNCLSPQPSRTGDGMEMHNAWSNHPDTSAGWADTSHFDPTRLDLSRDIHSAFQFYSLRDPDNIPHVSVDPEHAVDEYSIALGRHNADLKPEYLNRLADWADEERHAGNDWLADAIPRPDDYHASSTRTCPTCGNPLQGEYGTFCPQCSWSENDANLDSDPLSNPPDPTVDLHRGIQAAHKTADKLHDFLMNPKSRPDLQTPEGQRFLQHLERFYHNDRTDALMPWLTKEWKKGRIGYETGAADRHGEDESTHHLVWKDPDTGTGLNPGGLRRRLSPDLVNHWADFSHSNHPLRRQLGDIMRHEIWPFSQLVGQWDEAMQQEAHDRALQGGKVVHTTPDDWTVRQLTTPEELKAEGDAMGHCVGGYGGPVQRGESLIYSLRDPQGRPHVTTEIEPQQYEWVDSSGKTHRTDTRSYENNVPISHPIPHGGRVVQIQGKSNREPVDEHKARMADWFRSFSPEDRPRSANSEEEAYLHDDEGYTHSRLDHPALIPEYEREYGSLNPASEPTEDKYGLLRWPGRMDADYDGLLNNIKVHDYGPENRPDSDHIEDIYRLARERGEIPQLANALELYEEKQRDELENWMDQNDEYAPHYPDEPTGWEGEEDEWGDPQHFEEETEGARPYWQIRHTPGDPYNAKYYDHAEAEKAYEEEYADWERQHPGMNGANQMYNLLAPHSYNNTWNNEPQQPAQPTPPAQPQTFSSVVDHRTATTRSLYHGTLIDHLPSIRDYGLQPDVGGFTSDAYDLDEDGSYDQGDEDPYTAEEMGVRPAVYMTDKRDLAKAQTAMTAQIARKLDKDYHDVTPEDIAQHGLLVKLKGGDAGYGPNETGLQQATEEDHGNESQPYTVEPGDWWSEDSVGGDLQFITGPKILQVLQRTNTPRPQGWSAEQGQLFSTQPQYDPSVTQDRQTQFSSVMIPSHRHKWFEAVEDAP